MNMWLQISTDTQKIPETCMNRYIYRDKDLSPNHMELVEISTNMAEPHIEFHCLGVCSLVSAAGV